MIIYIEHFVLHYFISDSPVPNAYFAKLVSNKELSPEAKQNTAHQTAVTAGTSKHELPSNELTDEELLTLTQTEEVSTATTSDRQRGLHDVDQTLPSPDNVTVSQSALEQASCNSGRNISGDESMVVDEVAEHDYDASASNSADHENRTQAPQQSTWISCMVGNAFTYMYTIV